MAGRAVRVATLGLGFGAAVHVPALAALPETEVVALGAREPARAADAAERLGLDPALAVAGIDALLARRPQVVTLAVPPDQAEAAALRALDAGCAVLCEKPLAADAAAARRMAEAAASAGRPTAVDFQFAELPPFRRLHQALGDGIIGAPRHATVTWLMQSYAQKHGLWSWKSDATAGGGVMTLFGSHLLYLAEWLFGPATRLWAAFDNKATAAFAPAGAAAAEDTVHMRLEHAGGTVFHATFGNAAPGIHRHQWHVAGETGSLVLDNASSDYMRGFTLTGAGSAADLAWREPGAAEGDGRLPPFRALAERFLAAVREGTSFRPDFSDGARVQDLMEAARRSARTGEVVNITVAGRTQ
ncbi:oxidoreductase [Caenispirillum salinarum AK4]|uniref:Oxidoreductase n=1 Tax=Caenispirillum salinarum AK4 TaxID=1238182 RepID=K9GN06_9PROT|nr:Gfo/Idh/MocA family oxidoreductase [Caenispirillum salinarum]EKV26049.1 oxidoreductase [Caenispirillum salinarum AK4]